MGTRFKFKLRGQFPPDTTPDSFDFTDATLVIAETTNVTAANSVTVSGLGAGVKAVISVTGGQYRKNGGAWTALGGTVINGDVIEARGNASEFNSTTTSVLVNIGGVIGVFNITTEPPPGFNVLNVTLPRFGRKLLNSSVLNSVPSGNSVELVSFTGSGGVDLVMSAVYRHGDTLVGPGAGWNGTVESGFASYVEDGVTKTAPPTQETITTASCRIRSLMMWGERIDGDYTYGVWASAEGGIQKVRFYVEGTIVDVTAPKMYYWTDANGIMRGEEGYFITLDHSLFLGQNPADNTVSVYAKAYPVDTTLQTRVIGGGLSARADRRIWFYPEATKHDIRIDLTPSLPDAALGGTWPAAKARFDTLDKCIAYAGGATVSGISNGGRSVSPEIVCTETTTQYKNTNPFSTRPLPVGGLYNSSVVHLTKSGRTVIRAEPGATLTLAQPEGKLTSWQMRYVGVEFRGANVVWDRTNPYGPWDPESALGIGGGYLIKTHPYTKLTWFNGITIDGSIDWVDRLLPDGRSPSGTEQIVVGGGTDNNGGWYAFTECNAKYSNWSEAALSRHNFQDRMCYDTNGHIWLMVGCIQGRLDKNTPALTKYVDAIKVDYAGTALNWRVSNNNAKISLQINNGETIPDTTTLQWTTVREYSQVTYPHVSEMVAAMQLVTDDFTVTSLVTPLDNATDRHTSYIWGKQALAGETTLTVQAVIDLHTDFWDPQYTTEDGYLANFITRNNVVYSSRTHQASFLDQPTRDFEVTNNSIQSSGTEATIRPRVHKHLTYAHNTYNTLFGVYEDRTSEYPTLHFYSDIYSGFFNNVVPQLTIYRYLNDPFRFDGNHADTLTALYGSMPPVTNHSTSPAMSTLVDMENPRAPVSTSTPKHTPKVPRDYIGRDRGATDYKGHSATRITSGTFTKQQALDMAAVTMREPIGAGVNVATFRFKDGPGNTGNDVDLVITFNVTT